MLQVAQAKVLITGGTSGIGRGLAERFLSAGAQVLVTGREASKLSSMAAAHPGLLTHQGDIGLPRDREALAKYVGEAIPDLNVVINNAGIQRRVGLAEDTAPWDNRQSEIDMLFSGPVHLITLLLPTLLNGGEGLVINVTSGGAYIPQPFAPIYAACKAALHSYTVNLRHSLRNTPVRVVELIPPAVATGLAGPGNNHGAPLDAFCDSSSPLSWMESTRKWVTDQLQVQSFRLREKCIGRCLQLPQLGSRRLGMWASQYNHSHDAQSMDEYVHGGGTTIMINMCACGVVGLVPK